MLEVAERLLTVEEFAQLPDPPDGGKLELVCGRVLRMTPMGPDHGEGAAKLSGGLDRFAEEHGLGVTRVETGYGCP